MATITLTVVGSDVGTISTGVELSPADSDRLMAFLQERHGTDADGNARTPQQMIDAYWAGIVAGTIANVTRYEQDRDAQSARDAVTAIVATPI